MSSLPGERRAFRHYTIEARRRQLALRVRIASEQIADDKIETFLESQKPEFCSPIDGRPFSYDANRRVLIDSAPAYRNIVETKL